MGRQLAQLRDLAGRPRGGRDLVTRRDQPRNQVPSQCPGRSRDEDPHDLSFRLVLSLEDKAPPEAVTLSAPPSEPRLLTPAPQASRGWAERNDLHAARHAAVPAF